MSTTEILIDYITEELLDDEEDIQLKADDNILTTGLLDSMALMHLIVFIEQEFGMKIPVQEVTIRNFRTVGHITTYLQKRREALFIKKTATDKG